MYEHNALGFWSGLALCLTKVRSSRARCPATALITNGNQKTLNVFLLPIVPLVPMVPLVDHMVEFLSY